MTASDIEAVCSVYISSAQRQSELITLQFLLALSLCGWRGKYIHNFIIPALKWILSCKKRRELVVVGAFGRMFKDSRLF